MKQNRIKLYRHNCGHLAHLSAAFVAVELREVQVAVLRRVRVAPLFLGTHLLQLQADLLQLVDAARREDHLRALNHTKQ